MVLIGLITSRLHFDVIRRPASFQEPMIDTWWHTSSRMFSSARKVSDYKPDEVVAGSFRLGGGFELATRQEENLCNNHRSSQMRFQSATSCWLVDRFLLEAKASAESFSHSPVFRVHSPEAPRRKPQWMIQTTNFILCWLLPRLIRTTLQIASHMVDGDKYAVV